MQGGHYTFKRQLGGAESAGLGKAKLVFPDKKADHYKVQLFLEEKFPKLKSAGGFEVLRALGGRVGQRPLSLLPLSKEGYTITHLKEQLGQAVAHIRPLQADLDMTPLSKDCQVKASKINRQIHFNSWTTAFISPS